jgi:hypothetical protein
MASKLGCLPLYRDHLPDSDHCSVFSSGELELTAPLSTEAEDYEKVLRRVKRKLARLVTAPRQDLSSAMDELLAAADDLPRRPGRDDSIRLQLYCLEYPTDGRTEVRPVVVM